MTADGSGIAFQSRAPLTGFDNSDANSGEPDVEVFVYQAGGALRCVSCEASGAQPRGADLAVATHHPEPDSPSGVWGAAWIPGWGHPLHAANALSANGKRLFFNATAPLVPRDSNNAQDVYEWEAPGEGGCSEAKPAFHELNGGCVYLISSGENPFESLFVDASPDGSDVFFTTAASLLPQDPGLLDIYDARVEGGFPAPTETPICEGEACQSPPAAPNDATPASSSFEGPGNVVEPKPKPRCSKGKVRRHGKCVRKHRKAQAQAPPPPSRPRAGGRPMRRLACALALAAAALLCAPLAAQAFGLNHAQRLDHLRRRRGPRHPGGLPPLRPDRVLRRQLHRRRRHRLHRRPPPRRPDRTDRRPRRRHHRLPALLLAGLPRRHLFHRHRLGVTLNQLTEPGSWTGAAVYNLTPPPGALVRLGFHVFGEHINLTVDVGLRHSPPYAPIASARTIPQSLYVFGNQTQLWGNPSDPAHDALRGHCYAQQVEGLAPSEVPAFASNSGEECPVSPNPRPFLTLPTRCSGTNATSFAADSYESPGAYLPDGSPDLADPAWFLAAPQSPAFSGCEKLGLKASIEAKPTTKAAHQPDRPRLLPRRRRRRPHLGQRRTRQLRDRKGGRHPARGDDRQPLPGRRPRGLLRSRPRPRNARRPARRRLPAGLQDRHGRSRNARWPKASSSRAPSIVATPYENPPATP